MYPDLWPTREVGIQFLNFTEFDNKCAEYPMKEFPNLEDCVRDVKYFSRRRLSFFPFLCSTSYGVRAVL